MKIFCLLNVTCSHCHVFTIAWRIGSRGAGQRGMLWMRSTQWSARRTRGNGWDSRRMMAITR
jgi:hypothetical protein